MSDLNSDTNLGVFEAEAFNLMLGGLVGVVIDSGALWPVVPLRNSGLTRLFSGSYIMGIKYCLQEKYHLEPDVSQTSRVMQGLRKELGTKKTGKNTLLKIHVV